MSVEKINVKLDRVTVVGSFKLSPSEMMAIFAESGWTIGASKEDLCFELHRVTGDVDEIKAVTLKNAHQVTWRLDTSNHLNEIEKGSVSRILALMENKHLSRIDVAFDFINCRYSGMKHRIFKPNTTMTEIFESVNMYGRGKNLETVYAGRRKSLSLFRYYDKKRERSAAHQPVADDIESWERLELQLRGDRTEQWLERSKEMLDCFKLPNYEKLSGTQKLILQNLVEHPKNIKELTLNTRAKYRKLIRENRGFDTTYSEKAQKVLEEHLDVLSAEVNSFLIELHL